MGLGNERAESAELRDQALNSDDEQSFTLGSPLRIERAYSQRDHSGQRERQNHFLVVRCGEHEIVIRSSPRGQQVSITLDGRALR